MTAGTVTESLNRGVHLENLMLKSFAFMILVILVSMAWTFGESPSLKELRDALRDEVQKDAGQRTLPVVPAGLHGDEEAGRVVVAPW